MSIEEGRSSQFAHLDHVWDCDGGDLAEGGVASNGSAEDPVDAIQSPGAHEDRADIEVGQLHEPLGSPEGNTIGCVAPAFAFPTFSRIMVSDANCWLMRGSLLDYQEKIILAGMIGCRNPRGL